MGSSPPRPPDAGHRAASWALLRACAWSAVVTSALAVALHLARLGWGLDRTDEGQYLLLMADPSVSRSTVFLFGYVLHPLFSLLGGDIHLLRVAGTLITVTLSAALGVATARELRLDRAAVTITGVVAAAVGVGPMLYFPLTPSYNTLAFWGVTVWAAGLVLAASRAGLLGPVLLGVGGVVAFSGKATTGAALAGLTIAAALALVLLGPGAPRSSNPARAQANAGRAGRIAAGVVAGALVALLVLMALVGHGPAWLVDFYMQGARSVSLLQGHDDLVRWDEFSGDGFLALPALAAAGTVVAALWAVRRPTRPTLVLSAAGVVLTLTALATTLAGHPASIAHPVVMLAWWWLPVLAGLAAMIHPYEDAAAVVGDATAAASPGRQADQRDAAAHGGTASIRRTGPSNRLRATGHVRLSRASRVLLIVFLAVLPLVYVVGTNGNYWIAQSRAGLFWVVAGVVLLADRPAARRVFTAGAALFALVGASMSLAHGYRYESPLTALDIPTTTAQVSPEGAELRLTATDAQTSRDLNDLRATHHLDGVPILDVTGASPGYIRQLGGRPVGSSWLLGGYPGSLDAAVDAVRTDDPALMTRAWVIDAPQSPRRIDGLLTALGRSRDRDYELVDTFTHQLGYTVELLRPVGTSPPPGTAQRTD